MADEQSTVSKKKIDCRGKQGHKMRNSIQAPVSRPKIGYGEEIKPEKKRRYAVMKACSWSSFHIEEYPFEMITPKEGPQRFIPLFDTWVQVVLFAGGDETYIVAVEEI